MFFRNTPRIYKVIFGIYAVSLCFIGRQIHLTSNSKVEMKPVNNDTEIKPVNNDTFIPEKIDPFMPISPEYNSSAEHFNLEEKIPLAGDARQVFVENPVMTFIGVYDVNTRAITIMPALQENLIIRYDNNNAITEVIGSTLTEDEIITLKEKHKFYIPRRGIVPSLGTLTAHEIMVLRMGVPWRPHLGVLNMVNMYSSTHPYAPLYGFAATRQEETVKIDPESGTLNLIGKRVLSRSIPRALQDNIEKTFYEWIESHNKTNVRRSLLAI